MKILILAPYSSPIVQRLSKSLEKIGGHEIWVASFNAETNLEKRLIGLGTLNNFLDYFRFKKINKIIEDINPDVVHAHVINHYGVMALFQNKPLLVGLWGSDVMLAPNRGGILKRKIFEFINSVVAKRADMLHTSSAHVAEELVSKCGRAVKNKIEVFYWGFPVEKPSEVDYLSIKSDIYRDYGISSTDQLIVCPRGVSSTYNPDMVVKIIKKILENKHLKMKLVVFRGFATDEDVSSFKSKIKGFEDKIIFVNRLLSENELYVIYSQAKYHISVPISDALGGGVVEPFLRGSFPILSNILPYQNFIKHHKGYIVEDYDDQTLEQLSKELSENTLINDSDLLESKYSAEFVVKKFTGLYEKILNLNVYK